MKAPSPPAVVLAAAAALVGLVGPPPLGARADGDGVGVTPAPPPEASARLPVLDAASGAIDDDGQVPRVHAALVAEAEELAPGRPTRVGVRLVMDPGWHVYWRNPGGGAAPTLIDLDAPDGGARFGPVQWPAPARFSEADGLIVTYGYAGQVLLFAEAQVADGAGDQATVTARVDLLACASECIPASFALSAALPIAPAMAVDDPSAGDGPTAPGAAYVDHYAALVPDDPADVGVDVAVHLDRSAVRPGDPFRAAIEVVRCAGPPGPGDACPGFEPSPGGVPMAFIPDRIRGVTLRPVGVRPHPTAHTGAVVDLEGEAGPDDPRGDQALAGVLRLGGPAPVTLEVRGDLPRAPAGSAVAQTDGALFDAPPAPRLEAAAGDPTDAPVTVTGSRPVPNAPGVALVLLFAFLGGLVLNLMPCVLPVLAIKAFAFARLAHEGRTQVAAHAGAYTVGIVASLLALAGVVVGLRAAGTELGWGFQLQEPLFVALVAAVLVVFALNLFGVFEIAVGAGGLTDRVDRSAGLARSAGEGVLAVILATPCSAPFLGTAVGFAFASGPALTFAVFAVLGLGLAAPFALLVLVPGARGIVPKPGPWMDAVRRVLGFALLATVVWLAWVLGRVTGADGVVALLGFLLAVAFATWLVASGGGSLRGRLVRGVVGAAVVALVGAATLRFTPVAASSGTDVAAIGDDGGTDGALVWADYAPAAVDRAVAAGNVVLVDFTADWCITCKVNETMVLDDDDVRRALRSGDVALFKADWTQRDETIRAELARHGKAGVPLYLVYSPDRPDAPEVLPEVLTVERVLDALERARPAPRAATVDDAPDPPHTDGDTGTGESA